MAVNTFSSVVHTARHMLEVDLSQRQDVNLASPLRGGEEANVNGWVDD